MRETFAGIVLTRQHDKTPGLLFKDRRWTWAEVVQECADRAAALSSVPPPPDRQLHVGVLLENVPDYVFWIGAAAVSGAVTVGLNASRRGAELARDIRHADVDLVITESRLAHLLDGDHGLPSARILDIDDPGYAAFLAPYLGAALPAALPAPEDTAFLLFSSGSAGAPKAVIVGQGRLARLTPVLADRIELTRDSVTYLAMPLFHGNSVMMNLAPALATGATVAMTRKFSASGFSADIHRYQASYVNYVGRALSYVLSRPADPRDRDGTLRLAFGTEASGTDVARFAERFGCRVVEGYGMTEGVFRIGRVAGTPPGSLGRPAGDADIRVLDEATGQECPRARFDASGRQLNPGAVGQFVAAGLAHTFEGYYNNPAAMADRVRGADFWSGDLGYRDEEGWFWFAGRTSDWLRVNSENFAAVQVERIILRYPGIASAPVYAVPDPVTGDQVMCAVELVPGQDFDPERFGAFLGEQADLAGAWWPSFIRVTGAIPLTGSGKTDKGPLRRQAWNTADVVYRRDGRYVPLDDAGRRDLERQFTEHGRASLIPAGQAERASSGTSTCASGLPEPVTGSHPGAA